MGAKKHKSTELDEQPVCKKKDPDRRWSVFQDALNHTLTVASGLGAMGACAVAICALGGVIALSSAGIGWLAVAGAGALVMCAISAMMFFKRHPEKTCIPQVVGGSILSMPPNALPF